jgi:hypothetical protein
MWNELLAFLCKHGMSVEKTIEDDEIHGFHRIFTEQKQSFDCGIACCDMIMKWLDLEEEELYKNDIALVESPLWTIDIFLLLHHHGVSVQMFTKTFGVQPHHESLQWYKSSIDNDRERVGRQFQLALDRGLHLSKVC